MPQLALVTRKGCTADMKVLRASDSYASSARRIDTFTGDMVWTPPGERHWHGGSATTCMSHLAVSLGTTVWLDAVDEDSYLAEPSR